MNILKEIGLIVLGIAVSIVLGVMIVIGGWIDD